MHRTTIEDQPLKKENGTIRLSFIGRIKAMSRELIRGNHDELSETESHEIDGLPVRMQRASQLSSWSSAPEIESRTAVAERPLAGTSGRRRVVNQKHRREIEHTHSNLG
jgi:hypothetical protein